MIDSLVDTETYPLDDPRSPQWMDVVARARKELDDDGCCVLADFIRPSQRAMLRAECDGVSDKAYRTVEVVNVYNTEPDDSLPDDHPARIQFERGNAFVARDAIGPDLAVHRLYTDPGFQQLLAACLGVDEVFALADPLAGLCVNVLEPGHEHPWHFDTNAFAVSLLTQEPDEGGVFEYCPNIRSGQAENFADVRAVLTGDDDHRVRRLHLRCGDLQIFRGRFSLHRVSTVHGSTPRHTAILSYCEQPDVVGSPMRTRQLFGRVTAAHQDLVRVRGDELLD